MEIRGAGEQTATDKRRNGQQLLAHFYNILCFLKHQNFWRKERGKGAGTLLLLSSEYYTILVIHFSGWGAPPLVGGSSLDFSIMFFCCCLICIQETHFCHSCVQLCSFIEWRGGRGRRGEYKTFDG